MSEKINGIEQLNNSSILERVRRSLDKSRGTQDPDLAAIKIVDVVTKMNHRLNKEQTHVVVQFLQHGDVPVTQSFEVEQGQSFGAADEQPLSDQEYSLVMSMARKENN